MRKSTIRTDHIRAIERKSKAKRTRLFLSMGLNRSGREYRRTPNLNASERSAHYRTVGLKRYHRRTQRRALLGLTSRGRVRKYRGVRNRRLEFAYRQLRESIKMPVVVDWEQSIGGGGRERIRQELAG